MTKYSYTLVVEDIEKSVAFYQQYFNWNADRKVCVDKYKISTCIQCG